MDLGVIGFRFFLHGEIGWPPRGLPTPPHQQQSTYDSREDHAGFEGVHADHIQWDTEFIVRDASSEHRRHRRSCQRYD
jgi:hypothetical protein